VTRIVAVQCLCCCVSIDRGTSLCQRLCQSHPSLLLLDFVQQKIILFHIIIKFFFLKTRIYTEISLHIWKSLFTKLPYDTSFRNHVKLWVPTYVKCCYTKYSWNRVSLFYSIRGIDLAHRLLFEVEKHILRVRFLEGLSRGNGKRSFFLSSQNQLYRLEWTKRHTIHPEVKRLNQTLFFYCPTSIFPDAIRFSA
jgi:hypothetical protein